MNIDPFAEAARAEAERRWPMDALPVRLLSAAERKDRRIGFEVGAEWARTHLATEVRKAQAEAWQEGVNFALPGKETYWISKHNPHRATETGDQA